MSEPRKVVIYEEKVRKLSGVSNKTGKEYSMRLQEAYVQMPGKRHPRDFELTLEPDQKPYPAGTYYLDYNENIYFDRFGNLVAGSPVLQPVK